MAVLELVEPGRQAAFADLQAQLIGYADHVEERQSPEEVLNELHAIITRHLPLLVLGAARIPLKSGEWKSVHVGKSVFLHESVPEGWWEERNAVGRGKFSPLLFFAATSMAMHTWTEIRRMVQPIGIDKWSYDLALKHGMRDGLSCPVGGRWVLAFWSRRELTNVLARTTRIMIYTAASFAALRLDQLVDPDPNLIGSHVRLTPRELAVLRLLSTGAHFRGVAEALGVGEETVRTHVKKAQSKLGACNRTQAVAEALRQHLIP